MTSDLGVMTSRLQAVLHGDASQISQINQIGQVFTALTMLTNESTSLISLCSPALLSVAHPADHPACLYCGKPLPCEPVR